MRKELDMKIDQFPADIRPYLLPEPRGEMIYRCIDCKKEFDIARLLYTCPDCGSVLLLYSKNMEYISHISGKKWRKIFDYRRMLNHRALKGIFRYYEFIAPVIPLDHIIYLGEGHTPLVEANARLKEKVGLNFYFKNDGLNPSASFKDRGMACALSYINHFAKKENMGDLLAICASTGDTSASAALYASYLEENPEKRGFVPVTVRPSVAQAAMIGNPVSMPRVIELVQEYNRAAEKKKIFVVQVSEQEIMDAMIIANRNGNIACTQGGESLAGLQKALDAGYIRPDEVAVLDSTAHMLKFAVFQDMYFNDSFDPEFNINPKSELKNAPIQLRPENLTKYPATGKPLSGEDLQNFLREMAAEIAKILGLKKK